MKESFACNLTLLCKRKDPGAEKKRREGERPLSQKGRCLQRDLWRHLPDPETEALVSCIAGGFFTV